MKRARRKKQRGVVLFEALIAITMIIGMFAGVVYFHNAYTAKARALRQARMQAWLATDQACQGGGQGQGMELADVPHPYAAQASSQIAVSARHAMTCNERNDPRTTVSGVLEWSGLGRQLGNFGNMVLEAFKF